MRARTHRTVLLALAALAFVPLASDGGQAECWNAATSATSTAVGPVNGDEAFFKLPNGPANVMFLLDVSGSMDNFPQCGDNSWSNTGGTSGACTSPALNPGTPTAAAPIAITGTCEVSGINPNLRWMEAVTPQAEYADPGRSNTLLTDKPPWGNGCVGDNCLFDPEAYYNYSAWYASATGAGAYRRAHDLDAAGGKVDSLPAPCLAVNAGGTPITVNGSTVSLGAACTDCMKSRGFYFFRVRVYTGTFDRRGNPIYNNYEYPIFKGTFLNANPPKFVTARKVVKDMAWMDPGTPRKLDEVRLGLAILDENGTPPRKGRLIVPLGPDKTNSFPPTQAKFRQARQYLLSVINYDQSVYTDGGVTIIDGTTITGGFFHPASGYTPMGSALFNVGQYYTSTGRYNAILGTGYQTTAFNESASGDVNAPWARSNPNQCSICWACQNSSIVAVTDGSPNSEITFPNTISSYDTTGYNNVSNCGATGGCGNVVLPRVADWLHVQDLRDDAVMTAAQKVTVHTVGINMPAGSPTNILRATANLGGGIFQNASDPKTLGDAVFNAISQVIPKQDSFSSSAAASLQTVQTTASHAFLTRFKPNTTPTWEGHLFETFLFDEHTAGCDPTQPTLQVDCQGKLVDADYNGDGLCTGVFMVDQDCDELTDDPATGNLVKKADSTKAANVPWDAGQVLSDKSRTGYRSADESAASPRNIFTTIGGAKVLFTAANAATLLSYLNVTPSWCSAFLTRLGMTPSGTVATDRLTCAKEIIYFVRGWDTLDQDGDGCRDPGKTNALTCPSTTKGEERDRANDGGGTPVFWKLGDIFHSSPVMETAPITERRCRTGYENQCVMTIFSPLTLRDQTPIETYTVDGESVDAYEAYRKANINRKRVVIVGANDGMVHAFDAGDPNFSVSLDVTGMPQYKVGTGEELWAFIPPDLLPRLKDMVDGHQYMVDGSPMLRDVWVDGSGKEVSAADQKKQKDEFHTVMVIGRRSGGNSWTALDVTDPTNPAMLWAFPDPTLGDDMAYTGESWAEFSPRPPPIGPVRMASTADPRGFEERWVVMINGGYDPMLTLGRAVFMVDIWTGKTIWRITDPEWKASLKYGSGVSMFPVPGAIALTDIGDARADRQQDGFFDTATWGDLGGNLFVARFFEPGAIDATTKRVGNWYAGRAFEEQRQSDDQQRVTGRSEFFYMTANAWDPSSGSLRAFVGSGNREKIMAQSATCGTDNLFGCCQAGCGTVKSRTTYRSGTCEQSTTFTCDDDALSYVTTTSGACASLSCNSPGPGSFSAYHNIQWTCAAAGTQAPATGNAFWDGAGLVTVNPMAPRELTAQAGSSFRAQTKSRMYGVWAFGGKRTFFDPTSLVSFEKARLTDVAFGKVCDGMPDKSCSLINTTSAKLSADAANPLVYKNECLDGSTKCQATSDDPGWYYEYGDYCPLGSCSPAPPWTDEKTGASAQVIQACLLFSSFRPVGTATSTNPCSGNRGSPVAYDYRVNWVTGTPNVASCGSPLHAVQRAITSPPSASIVRVDLLTPKSKPVTPPPEPGGPPVVGALNLGGGGCAGGGITYGALSMDMGSGAQKTAIATESCAVEPLYWLELSAEEHVCRHVTPADGAASTCR